MRVGVDATSWVNRRGFGRFARNAVARLTEIDPETEYVLYIDHTSARHATLPGRATVRAVRLDESPTVAASADSGRSVRDLLRLRRAVVADRLDAFLFTSAYTYFPVGRVPTLVGLHDTILDDFPELTSPFWPSRVRVRLKYAAAVRRARGLFTVSEASRAALAKRLRLAPERLAVVPEAPDPVFSPRAGAALAAGLATAGLADERYFVYAGGISPHKNLERLVDAYAELVRRRTEPPLLVIAGELEGETFVSAAHAVSERVEKHELGSRVRFPGFVSDETLACLYSGAIAAVNPSLAEGFGLPAVEAAACGAPVVLSDLGPHRETLDNAALFFAATDTAALAEKLDLISGDDDLRRDVGRRCREAVASLTWDATAAKLEELLRGLG